MLIFSAGERYYSAPYKSGKAKASPGFGGLEVLFLCLGGCLGGLFGIIFLPILFIIIWVLQLVVILPYLFVLLLTQPAEIETTADKMNERVRIMEGETTIEKAKRLIKMILYSVPMFFLLLIWPLVIVFHIIPTYANADNSRGIYFKKIDIKFNKNIIILYLFLIKYQ